MQKLSFIIMTTLLWIIIFGFLMSCIALVGGILVFILTPERSNIICLALVAFAAGSLMGGALLDMILGAVEKMGNVAKLYV
jgi:zinc and cadmium transporter